MEAELGADVDAIDARGWAETVGLVTASFLASLIEVGFGKDSPTFIMARRAEADLTAVCRLAIFM
jgi:hypothetical protein